MSRSCCCGTPRISMVAQRRDLNYCRRFRCRVSKPRYRSHVLAVGVYGARRKSEKGEDIRHLPVGP